MYKEKQKLKDQFWEWVDDRPGDALNYAKELIALCQNYSDEPESRTLLHDACHQGNLDTVKILVEAGFNINAYFDQRDHCSDTRGTPLTEAISSGADDIIEYLLSFENLNVLNLGFNKSDDDEYWVKGSYTIPFNELFNTRHIERVIELGGTPNDYDYDQEEDSLLWVAFSKGDIQLLEKLIKLGANTQIDGEYGPYIHMVLQQYFDTKDEKWIHALKLLIAHGVDLNTRCNENENLMQRILQSHDIKLFELAGIEEDTLKEVAEYYEQPQPNFPYELFHTEVKADYICRNTLPALMDGYYGWETDKLFRILTLIIAAVEEELGQDTPYDDELGYAWQNLDEAQVNAFLNEKIIDLDSYQQDYKQFIAELEKYKKLNNPSDRLMMGLENINFRFKEKQKELGLEPNGLSARVSC